MQQSEDWVKTDALRLLPSSLDEFKCSLDNLTTIETQLPLWKNWTQDALSRSAR